MIKCPVYKCPEVNIPSDSLLKKHFQEKHKDLIDLGMDLQMSSGSSQGLMGNPSLGNLKGKLKGSLVS